MYISKWKGLSPQCASISVDVWDDYVVRQFLAKSDATYLQSVPPVALVLDKIYTMNYKQQSIRLAIGFNCC